MNSDLQSRILSALGTCLRPLARVLLRSGISYRQFSEVAKLAFVHEALADKDQRGRIKNISRVAIRTGLSRKEVARIKKRFTVVAANDDSRLAASPRSSHAARVLQLWHVDPAFVDHEGNPKVLPVSGDSETFSALVRAAGGDVPPGAVRAELLAAHAINEMPDGRLAPVRRYFVPSDVGEDLVVGLTHILAPVLEVLAHNTGSVKHEPFVQRLAYSDRLIPAAVPLFRHLAQARATDFLQSIDDWLSSNEESTPRPGAKGLRVGVGVFYYEGAQTGVECNETSGMHEVAEAVTAEAAVTPAAIK